MGGAPERPTGFAPYVGGIIASSVGGGVLFVNAVGELGTDPRGAVGSFAVLVLAPAAMLVFGFVSAVPRKRRHRELSRRFPSEVVVEAIVLTRTRQTLRATESLQRAYTVSLVVTDRGVDLWRRGFAPTLTMRLRSDELAGLRTGTARHPNGTVAAMILDTVHGEVALPVIGSRQWFNMPAGHGEVDRAVRAVARRLDRPGATGVPQQPAR